MTDGATAYRERIARQPPVIGATAPVFEARTTMGDRNLADYRGRWLVFFSHPADFTPVCTSEFVSFAKAFPRFKALGCELLGLSVDSLFSHFAWKRSIAERFGVEIPFPIAEDPSMAIAAAYGMLQDAAPDSSTVRGTFVIDPAGLIRAMSWYPMSTGRSIEEILRLVQALQTSDAGDVSTPEGWRPGDKVIDASPIDAASLAAFAPSDDAPDWYYRLRNL